MIWPWLNWLLPIGLVALAFWQAQTARGEHSWLITLSAPLMIPLAGLLGSLPRFLLRRRGVRTAPPTHTTLLMVLWWSAVGFALAMPDRTPELHPGDAVPVPSLLHRLIGGAAGGVFASGLFAAATVCGAVAWVALVALSASRAAWPRPLGGQRIAGMAFALAPLLLAGVAAAGVGLGQLQPDAAGERRPQAISRTAQEQSALAVQRYDALQQTVSDLRAAVSPHGWDSLQGCAQSLNQNGRDWDAYRLRLAFQHPAIVGLDHAVLATTLTDAGWTLTRLREAPLTIEASGPQGAELIVAADGDAPLAITAISGPWWQSADRPVSAAECSASGGAPGSVGARDGADADWWPPLR